MDIGNDVDLSNENITPLWKRRTDSCTKSQGSSKSKSRPLSYHLNGVMTTDFPVEDSSSFTLTQPAERLVVTPHCWEKNNTVFLKHVLHKPSPKSRVVRSISIGHFSNGLFSLSKFRSEDSRSFSFNNRVYDGDNREQNRRKTSNGDTAWTEKCLQDPQKSVPFVDSLNSQKEHTAFRSDLLSDEDVALKCSPVLSNNSYDPQDPCFLSSTSSSSPPVQRTPTPSHSSTSSILSLSSLSSSDPPTPRSPSPADRGQAFHRQSSSSSTSSQDTRHASSSSSLSSTSPSPSLSPTILPSTSIVLSTHSRAAMKMGTQQLIPKGLASDIRQSKTPSGTQGQGLAGLLGLDHSKRSLKALSMVETGTYFSTGRDKSERVAEESESPGTLKRGLRSTSYRRAVVSGAEVEAPSVALNASRLSQPTFKLLDGDNRVSQASLGSGSPIVPGTPKLTSPGTPKPTSPGTTTPTSPGTPSLKSPGTTTPISPRISKLTSPGKGKVSNWTSLKRCFWCSCW